MRAGFHVALIAVIISICCIGCSPYRSDVKPSDQNINQINGKKIPSTPTEPAEAVPHERQPDKVKAPSILHDDQSKDRQPDVRVKDNIAIRDDTNPYYYYTAAQLSAQSGDINQAIEYLKKSIEADPKSDFLKRELVHLYLRQRDIPAAMQIVEQHLKVHPDDLDMLVLYGRIKQNQNQIHQAQLAYQKVIEKDPLRKNVYLMLGSLLMDRKKLPEALKIYEKLIQVYPASYVGHFFIGKIHAMQGDFKKAEESFNKTLALEPGLEEPRFELLDIYQAQGNKKKIIQTYQQILENNPNNIRASMALGYFYEQNKKFKQANDIFIELGKRSLSDRDVFRKTIQLYLDTEKFDQAVVILEGMLKGAPNSSELHYIAGVAYNGLKDTEKTIAHLSQVGPESLFYVDAVAQLSLIYQEKKQFDSAIAILKQGLKVDVNNVNLRYRLGIVYDLDGLKSLSIEEMKTIIQLDPEHANAMNYLGYTYAEMGENLDEAERLVKEALKYRPEDGFFTDSLGWVYYKKGLIDQAVVLLEKAVGLEPNDPVILEHLGDAYLKANDKTKALELYNRSLSEQKEDKERQAEIEKKIKALTGKGS